MAKNYLLAILFVWLAQIVAAQVENTGPIVDWRQHNLTRYNKFLVNPAYSYVREDSKSVSFWSRVQWTGVDNSPQTFLLNYSGKVSENSGAGLGLYQQNLGLLVDSGLILNYAYSVQLGLDSRLTFGLNTTLFRRGIDKNAINPTEPDPLILENQDDFLFLLMPGMNLTLGSFDLGVYAENLIDYNFNDGNKVTDFSDKIYSSQLAYTKPFKWAGGMLEDGYWRTLTYVKSLPEQDMQYGINSMVDMPYYGWIMAGYNNVYGISGGIGVKLGDGISIGINYENGSSQTNKAFGSTWEAIATIDLGPRKMRKNAIPTNGKVVKAKNKEEEVNNAVAENDTDDSADMADTSNDSYSIVGGSEKTSTTSYTVAGGGGNSSDSKSQTAVNNDGTAANTNNTTTVVVDAANEGVSGAKEKQATDDKHAMASSEETGVTTTTTGTTITPEQKQVLTEEEAAAAFVKETDSIIKSLSGKTGDKNSVTLEVFGEDSSYKTIPAAEGIEKGFYLIVNVFSQESYFTEFMTDLDHRGFTPEYFINPANDYYYVYLRKSTSYVAIKNEQRSNLSGSYTADKWVLWVK
ncbi:PorP/SprF family type IX secretion system membrane protein [Robertkochia solimangrovi]|uniref:PorP/SprF family type IX secretion system membrane protein n=1 Tax=Robertkochia solimangrovi TaxID=2213046 RepID=UPI00117F5C20|nr:PorP/SprF family type IX secretion system membrane protein [Robertkochia solimangrovi]TRZ45375.1 hypothetical protein DMZ48_06425 [Robertkochia solimangrovi]